MNKTKKGFTLFELLVSISIIGVLTALAIVSFSVAQKKARDAKRLQDMGLVQKAAEQYYSQASYSYPAGTAPADWTAGGQEVLSRYPVDPKNVGWTGYSYRIGTTYCACAAVENSANGNASNNSCGFAASGPFYCVKSQQ